MSQLDPASVALSVVMSIGLFVFGIRQFGKMERNFADLI
jgi:hypothetical protein